MAWPAPPAAASRAPHSGLAQDVMTATRPAESTHHNSTSQAPISITCPPDLQPAQAYALAAQQAAQPQPPLSADATGRQAPPLPRPDNIFELFADAIPRPQPAQPNMLPTCFADANDPILGERVQMLLNSAHQLTSIKGKNTHPHQYIFRGPNRVKTTLNMLSELEYVYGLYRLVTDPKTSAEDKPMFSRHVLHVAEDGAEFQWEQVRSWSEDMLTKIADGRLKWSDVLDLHALRHGTSRNAAGRRFTYLTAPSAAPSVYAPPASAVRPQQSAPTYRPYPTTRPYPPSAAQASATQDTVKKFNPPKPLNRADAPCKAFNSQSGCTKPDSHVDNGQPMGHHCAWCRANLHRVHYHAEASCRIRLDPNSTPFHA